jgi:hypothetical protein
VAPPRKAPPAASGRRADYREPAASILEKEELALDEEHSAHRYLEAIEHTVVGFYWEW